MILCRCFTHAPTFVLLVVALIAKVTCASEIPLGAIVMQLRSTVDTKNTTELNDSIGDVTMKYLNQYFGAYYSRTEQLSPDYFTEINLSTNSFGVHGVEGSFITTIEIEGTLTFNADEVPSSMFIDTLLRNAFTGRNEKLYLDQLLKIEDEFLQNLTYLIIDINMGKVTESTIRDKDKSSTGNAGAPSQNDEEPVESGKQGSTLKWVTVVMYVTIVILALMILTCGYYAYRRCKKGRATEERGGSKEKEPMKVIKLPVKAKPSSSSRPSSNKDTKNIVDDKIKFVNDNISPTSTETTRSSQGSIAARMDRSPPTPQRSMTSQASSFFTYSDNMSRFTTGNKSPGLFSRFSFDSPSIDIGATRGGRQDPPAFRSDLSVIEKQNDLSLIPEEQGDLESGLKNNRANNARRKSSRNQSMSRKSRVALDARHSKSRYSNRSETYFYNERHLSNDDNDSDAGLEMSTDDVLSDLKNLSIQIHRQRNGRTKRTVYL